MRVSPLVVGPVKTNVWVPGGRSGGSVAVAVTFPFASAVKLPSWIGVECTLRLTDAPGAKPPLTP